ncbi:hypothetical protein VIGAN_10086500, partial [Vigna angularis var. angularis]
PPSKETAVVGAGLDLEAVGCESVSMVTRCDRLMATMLAVVLCVSGLCFCILAHDLGMVLPVSVFVGCRRKFRF